ncbi:MAG: hypothetical protein V2J10_00735 [Wenzhouxiangella sp.]|jgi:hypothetical protein|nr:hypothetical protein [Wenzhouxiangella sp.]
MTVLRIIAIAFFAVGFLATGQAQTDDRFITIDELGALEIVFEEASRVDRVPGSATWAEVSHRRGAAFRVHAPRRIGQADYLVAPGQRVVAGQPIARLSGPEVEHWQLELESIRSRFLQADDRYRRNQPLFESNALAESIWTEISDQWHALRLEYKHMSHFAELLDDANSEDGLLLIAPFDAFATYQITDSALARDETIASFIPIEALRIRTRTPAADRSRLVAIRAGACELAIDEISEQASGFLIDVWSEALAGRCDLLPGQTLSIVPLYRAGSDGQTVVRVPESALLNWDHRLFLLVREDNRLYPEPIEVLGADGSDLLVLGPASLVGREVLARSVSAIQGILIGLGGE